MPLDKNARDILHLRNQATPGKKYLGDDNQIYIGTKEGRLTLLVQTGESPIVQSKEITVDFGEDLFQTSKTFTIIDPNIKPTHKIIISPSFAPTLDKTPDEIEMDDLSLKAVSGEGHIKVFATSSKGSVTGKFKLNYIILR